MPCPVTRLANVQVSDEPPATVARRLGDSDPAGKSTSETLVVNTSSKSRTCATPSAARA